MSRIILNMIKEQIGLLWFDDIVDLLEIIANKLDRECPDPESKVYKLCENLKNAVNEWNDINER